MAHLTKKRIIISTFFVVVALIFQTKSLDAESLSGSTYSLDGGVVYQGGNVSGATYSVSGAGGVVVGEATGGTFTQSGSVFDADPVGNVSTPPVLTGTATGGSTAVGYTFGGNRGVLEVRAYSFYKNELTLVVSGTNEQDISSLVLVSDKEYTPTNLTLLGKNIYMLRFTGIKPGKYSLVLKSPIGNTGAVVALYDLTVKKEGGGIVAGPDSNILNGKDSNGLADGAKGQTTNHQAVGSTTVDIETQVDSQRSVEIKPIIASSTKETATTSTIVPKKIKCIFWGIDCAYLIPVYLLIVLLLGYIIYRVMVVKSSRS